MKSLSITARKVLFQKLKLPWNNLFQGSFCGYFQFRLFSFCFCLFGNFGNINLYFFEFFGNAFFKFIGSFAGALRFWYDPYGLGFGTLLINETDFAFFLYDLEPDKVTNTLSLKLDRVVYTKFANALEQIAKFDAGSLSQFTELLQKKLDNKLSGKGNMNNLENIVIEWWISKWQCLKFPHGILKKML